MTTQLVEAYPLRTLLSPLPDQLPTCKSNLTRWNDIGRRNCGESVAECSPQLKGNAHRLRSATTSMRPTSSAGYILRRHGGPFPGSASILIKNLVERTRLVTGGALQRIPDANSEVSETQLFARLAEFCGRDGTFCRLFALSILELVPQGWKAQALESAGALSLIGAVKWDDLTPSDWISTTISLINGQRGNCNSIVFHLFRRAKVI